MEWTTTSSPTTRSRGSLRIFFPEARVARERKPSSLWEYSRQTPAASMVSLRFIYLRTAQAAPFAWPQPTTPSYFTPAAPRCSRCNRRLRKLQVPPPDPGWQVQAVVCQIPLSSRTGAPKRRRSILPIRLTDVGPLRTNQTTYRDRG